MISFFVPGTPRPKQSFRVGARGRGFQPARVKSWQSDVGWGAKQAMHAVGLEQPIAEEVWVRMRFAVPDRQRRDLDNLSKGTLDGLQGICIEDDCQIVDLHLEKYVAKSPEECGVQIEIGLTKLV